MVNLNGWNKAYALVLFYAATAIASPAQKFETLVTFDGSNGSHAFASFTQGTDGRLYSTTSEGGMNGAGTIFKITPAGTLTTLYNFCAQLNCADGGNSDAGLVQATDGNFYGTTVLGGANDDAGTIFKINPRGAFASLYSFCAQTNCADGNEPSAGLIQAIGGGLYGPTWEGGTNGAGTIFKITSEGKLTTLYNFCAQTSCADGANPAAGLVEATDGNFYGTTSYGGLNDAGTVFKITPAGTLTTIYTFCPQRPCIDGYAPQGALVQADDEFYGTTFLGGANNEGTVFKVTPQGALTVLYSFCAQADCADGSNPASGVIQGSDGNFYGTSSAGVTRGSTHGYGTVFEITPEGALTTLHSFDYYDDGAGPVGGLLQATNGAFYGTTPVGGANLDGTVFSLSTGLFPFVKTLPAAGKVGEEVGILGTNLASAKGVTFNGTAAQFNIVSSNLIVAHVPAGATTGKVEVTFQPAHYVLYSNVPFYVLK